MKHSIQHQELENLEQEIASFYTQTFFNCFRRAPIISRRISDKAAALCPLFGRRDHAPVLAPHIENDAMSIVNDAFYVQGHHVHSTTFRPRTDLDLIRRHIF